MKVPDFLKSISFRTYIVSILIISLLGCVVIYATRWYIEIETNVEKENLLSASREISDDIKLKISRAFDINRYNKNTLKVSTLNEDEMKMSRDEIIANFKEQLLDNPDFLGLYTLWEPNAFDGKDTQFKNKPYHDSTGRFLPYVVRTRFSIKVEPLKYYNQQGIGDYYLLPKKRLKETITNPYS